MRILILANKGSDHAKKCAEGLYKHGHEILVVSPNDNENSVHVNSNINTVTLKYGGKKGYLLNVFELKKVCKRFKPDVVNVHYASGCGALSYFAKLHPAVINCYGSDVFEFPRRNKFNNWLLKRILKYADGLASTSRGMAKEIKSILGNEKKRIAITPFGIDADFFRPYPRELNNHRMVIGIVKSMKPIYDIPLLINAFSIIYDHYAPRPLLRIYGDGPMKNELKHMCEGLNISDSVEFMGGVPNEEIPKALNLMDVFVNCSKQESFGVNILEAMACELPVIATDCVGPRELIEDGKSGLILKERTPKCLADTIIYLLNNETMRREMGKNGRKRVLEYYDWQNNIKELEKVLDNCNEKKEN